MNKQRIKANIEVAVRARPLNTFENRDGEETAWEIKHNAKKHDYNDVIQLKNKYRFGFSRPAEKRVSRSISMANRAGQQARNGLGARSVSQTILNNNRRNLDESWKYKSGIMRRDFQSVYGKRSTIQKEGNGQVNKTPAIQVKTPTPLREQLTPENASNISDFKAYGGPQIGRSNGGNSIKIGGCNGELHRANSLTAIQSYKKSKSITRAGEAEYRNRFTTRTSFKVDSNPFTARKSGLKPSRARSVIGTKSEVGSGEQKGFHLQNKFKYDAVYGEKDTNLSVYKKSVGKIAMSALEGVNGTVFVYGQTGTGKTYTMMGHQRTKNDQSQHGANVVQEMYDANGNQMSQRMKDWYDLQENSGVLIYAMQDLLKRISQIEMASRELDQELKFQLKLSYIEIYNELVYDLLVVKKQEVEQNLTIHEAKNREFLVNGANQIEVSTIEQVLELIKIGERNKHYAETFLNHCSSRSHTMFRLNIVQYRKTGHQYLQTKSYLNFVDLAGSERISNYFGSSKTNQASDFYQMSRLKEGLSINKSLFNLTQVIHMLSQKPNHHIPYRNSTLTKLLRSSLGGNSMTSIIICITPANSQVDQTISSLKFGEKAMKVQNSAKVQVSEMRLNGIKNRFNLSSLAGVEERIIKEVVEEYEAKIRGLEKLLYDNTEVYKLKKQVKELELQRQRLIAALETSGDRTFFIKQLMNRQKRGYQEINLRHAGDIAIQSRSMALNSIDQLLDEKDHLIHETSIQDQCNKKFVDYVSQELKNTKSENQELKVECDKLENAYQDIIAQFSKMSQMQQELMRLSNPDNQMVDMANIEKLTDREILRIDQEFKKNLNRIKEEKGKRNRLRKSNENMSMNSSGHIKNFMRPYNITTLYSTNRKNSSAQSLSQRSKNSSPGYKNQLQMEFNYRDPLNERLKFDIQQELNPEHFSSRQPISEEHIMNNKNLNSTFGMKRQKSIETKHRGHPRQNGQTSQIFQHVGVNIDKSIYTQDFNYRPSGYTSRSQSNEPKVEKSTSRSHHRPIDEKKLLLPVQMPNKPKEVYYQQVNLVNHASTQHLDQQHRSPIEQDQEDNSNLPFAPINSFNQYLMQKHNLQNCETIKEEVQRENQVSSFENLSHSQGFDITTHPIPCSGISGASGTHHVNAVSSNSSISNVNLHISANAKIIDKHTDHHSIGTFMNTPQKQELKVQPELIENIQSKLMENDSINCHTFDKTISKLSSISGNIKTKSQCDQHLKADSLVDMMNQELLMEFQLEQLLNRQQQYEFELMNQVKQLTANQNKIVTYPYGQHQVEESPVFSNEESHQKQETTVPKIIQKISQRDYVSFQKQDSDIFTHKQSLSHQQSKDTIKEPSVKRSTKSKSKSKKRNTDANNSKASKHGVQNQGNQYNTGSNSNSCSVLQTSTSNTHPIIHSEQFQSNQQKLKTISKQESNTLRPMIMSSDNHFLPASKSNSGTHNQDSELHYQSNDMEGSCNTSKQNLSRKTKNFSIDLSSTIKKSPEKYQIGNDQQDMFDKLCIDVNLQDANQDDHSYMEIIQNSNPVTSKNRNKGKLMSSGVEKYSDTLTPYGPIDTSVSERNCEMLGKSSTKADELIQEEQLVNLYLQTKTPNNCGVQDGRHFFGQCEAEYAACMYRFPNESESKENSSVKEVPESRRLLEPFREIKYHDLNESSQNQSHLSKLTSNHTKSQSNSFKPGMTKEIAQIEKTNQKLKQHNEQYKQIYRGIVQMSTSFESEFKSQASKKSQFTQRGTEQMLLNPNQIVNQPVPTARKRNKISRDNSNSIMSHSTSQGMTSYEHGNTKAKKQNRFVEGNSHRISQDFDLNSKTSAMSGKSTSLAKKSLKSKQSVSKAGQESKSPEIVQGTVSSNSPMGFQLMNERLNHFSSQIEPNWQMKSQASLDKMQQLQREYEQIQKRRQKIIANLEGNPNNAVFLRDAKPKVKNFEPMQRKHSPTIHFNPDSLRPEITSSSAMKMRNLEQQWRD